MKSLNQTVLLFLLSQCERMLEDRSDIRRTDTNETIPNATQTNESPEFKASSPRETYDNAYFYILFVMLFYSLMAMTLFKCFIGSEEEKRDPHEEFIATARPSTQTHNADHMVEKFDFEEESSS